ncbi:hypothetical protein VP01_768g9 [Puccinia sorghi]|uniref:Uncharacterized protein n=1 Tax=Puccinia sorghi TaxID=27349 RepID=A0A0L6UDR7_9BASI|nr:hypothetical protein VP01_768g9 [Puccinia sorghi]
MTGLLIVKSICVAVPGAGIKSDELGWLSGREDGSTLKGHSEEEKGATERGLERALRSYADAGFLDGSRLPQLMMGLKPLIALQAADGRLGEALSDLFAVSALGLHQLGNGGRHDLLACLSSVFQLQGLPPGASCVGIAGRTVSGIKSLINLVLEQYLGIFSTKTIEEILELMDQSLGGLVPSQSELFSLIHEVLVSVASSLTGNGVTALEKTEECFVGGYATQMEKVDCLKRGGSPMEVALAGVLEQMVGVFPPSVMDQVVRVVRFHLAYTPLGSLPLQLAQSLHSLAARLGPAAVTHLEKLQLLLRTFFHQPLILVHPAPAI